MDNRELSFGKYGDADSEFLHKKNNDISKKTQNESIAIILTEAALLLNDDIDTLNEGAVKTSKKKKLDRYLAKYGYDKKNGTITVNGTTVDVKKGNTNHNGYHTHMNIDSGSGKNTLVIGKEFSKLKNNKRRDAILNHEIMHAKTNNLKNPNTTLDHKIYTAIDLEDKNLAKIKNPTKEDRDRVHNAMKSYLYSTGYKDPSEYNDKEKAQVKNLKIFSEYTKNDHTTPLELEADAYARYSKNGNHLDRAQREVSKHIRKSNEKELTKRINKTNDKKEKKYLYESNKFYNKNVEEQRISRKKATTDKRIDRSAYNESVAILLTEAALLLNESRQDEKDILYKKPNGSYLIKASSGRGYTAFNDLDICIGGIDLEDAKDDATAIRLFKNNKLS